MGTLQLEVLTPEKQLLDEPADMVSLKGSQGRLGILPGHTALITKLDIGELGIESGGKRQRILCGQGFAEIKDNLVTVLVRSAERRDEIDRERAKRAKERAKSRLGSKDEEVDMVRAEAALRRAVERLHFSK